MTIVWLLQTLLVTIVTRSVSSSCYSSSSSCVCPESPLYEIKSKTSTCTELKNPTCRKNSGNCKSMCKGVWCEGAVPPPATMAPSQAPGNLHQIKLSAEPKSGTTWMTDMFSTLVYATNVSDLHEHSLGGKDDNIWFYPTTPNVDKTMEMNFKDKHYIAGLDEGCGVRKQGGKFNHQFGFEELNPCQYVPSIKSSASNKFCLPFSCNISHVADPTRVTYFLILRDPRDVVISESFHRKKGAVSKYLRKKLVTTTQWTAARYLWHKEKLRDSTVFLSYEGVRSHTDEFLNFLIKKFYIEGSANATTLEKVKVLTSSYVQKQVAKIWDRKESLDRGAVIGKDMMTKKMDIINKKNTNTNTSTNDSNDSGSNSNSNSNSNNHRHNNSSSSSSSSSNSNSNSNSNNNNSSSTSLDHHRRLDLNVRTGGNKTFESYGLSRADIAWMESVLMQNLPPQLQKIWIKPNNSNSGGGKHTAPLFIEL